MRILQCYPDQLIWIGDDIQIMILGHSNGVTRIGINAPPELQIVRQEIIDADELSYE